MSHIPCGAACARNTSASRGSALSCMTNNPVRSPSNHGGRHKPRTTSHNCLFPCPQETRPNVRHAAPKSTTATKFNKMCNSPSDATCPLQNGSVGVEVWCSSGDCHVTHHEMHSDSDMTYHMCTRGQSYKRSSRTEQNVFPFHQRTRQGHTIPSNVSARRCLTTFLPRAL